MEANQERAHTRKNAAADIMAALAKSGKFSSMFEESYKDYKNYSYKERAIFPKDILPADLKRSVKVGIKNYETDCYLYSVTEIADEFFEIAFKVDDIEKFNAWNMVKKKATDLINALNQVMKSHLPEGVKVEYIRFKQGSLVIIIGLTLIAAAAGIFLGAAVFFSALSGLFGLYRALMDNEKAKEFIKNFDKKVWEWMKAVMIKIEDWLQKAVRTGLHSIFGNAYYLLPFPIIIIEILLMKIFSSDNE